VWRDFNSDEAKRKNYFLGKRIFRFASANLFLNFVRPQKGVWGMNAGGLNFIFWRGRLLKKETEKEKAPSVSTGACCELSP